MTPLDQRLFRRLFLEAAEDQNQVCIKVPLVQYSEHASAHLALKSFKCFTDSREQMQTQTTAVFKFNCFVFSVPLVEKFHYL